MELLYHASNLKTYEADLTGQIWIMFLVLLIRRWAFHGCVTLLSAGVSRYCLPACHDIAVGV